MAVAFSDKVPSDTRLLGALHEVGSLLMMLPFRCEMITNRLARAMSETSR
jgi:hypothetical protein